MRLKVDACFYFEKRTADRRLHLSVEIPIERTSLFFLNEKSRSFAPSAADARRDEGAGSKRQKHKFSKNLFKEPPAYFFKRQRGSFAAIQKQSARRRNKTSGFKRRPRRLEAAQTNVAVGEEARRGAALPR